MSEQDGTLQLFTKDDTTGEFKEYEAPSFQETLPEDLRENDSFKEIGDVGTLAKNYADLNSKAQELEGKIPQVPESADAYELEADDSNEQLVGEFKQYAHEIGLTQEQAKKLVEFNNGKLSSLTEQANTKHKEAMDALKEEWGTAWDQNLDNAKKAVGMIENTVTGMREFLDMTGLGDNPLLLKAFAEIGRRMGEGDFIKSEQPPSKKTTSDGRPMLNFTSMQD